MNRKPTKNTRGPNAKERDFHRYLKTSDCGGCNNPGPSIVHHCEGATFKHNKTLIGHWFCIPLCVSCDNVITLGSRKRFIERFGPQCEIWDQMRRLYADEYEKFPPNDVYEAIMGWGR